MYSNAQYMNDIITGQPSSIRVEINGMTSYVPLDPANSDYAAIMKLVAEGKLVIQPADPVTSGGNN